MMHGDTDPDTQVRHFEYISLQFILTIAIPILGFILAILIRNFRIFQINFTRNPSIHLQN